MALPAESRAGTGTGTPLFDAVLGTELARVDATGIDRAIAAVREFATQPADAPVPASTGVY